MQRKPKDNAPIKTAFDEIDTEEIKNRLLNTSAGGEDDGDDEFDFGDDDDDVNDRPLGAESSTSVTSSSTQQSEAVRRAIEQVAATYSAEKQVEDDLTSRAITAEELKRRIAEEEESGMVEDRFHDPDAPILFDLGSPSRLVGTHQAGDGNQDTATLGRDAKQSILKQAQKALAEVTEVYGSGLGDQEILLLDSQNDSNTTAGLKVDEERGASAPTTSATAATAAMGPTGMSTVIEEGDEDAAELEDSEEAMLERMRQMDLETERRRIEEEWDQVAAEAAPPPPASSTSTTAVASTSTAQPPPPPPPAADATTAASAELVAAPRIGSSKDESFKGPVMMTAESTDGFFSSALEDDDDLTELNRAREQQLARVASGKPRSKAEDTFITYRRAITYFENRDLSAYVADIVVSEPRAKSGWFGSGAPKPIDYPGFSSRDLNFPFLIAQIDFDPSVPPMLNMLLTIYNFCLENYNGKNPAATGDHWEKIGFQGSDPRTDLNRSMKMLSVVQVRK